MKKQKTLWAAWGLLGAFALWTAVVCLVDVRAIGPNDSAVGLAGMNGFFHRLTGVHMTLYTLTDWLSLVPLGLAAGFALLGLAQWVIRKSLRKVDCSIFALGGFYMVVMVVFLFFEEVVVNYRPVLIEGVLEASYPSSTTMLVLCVMPTAMMQLGVRIRDRTWRCAVLGAMMAFTAFMVLGRLVSGVHWLSDIIGGALLSGGLVLLYAAACGVEQK